MVAHYIKIEPSASVLEARRARRARLLVRALLWIGGAAMAGAWVVELVRIN